MKRMPGPGERVVVVAGVLGDREEAGGLEYCRRSTHDSLIRLLGGDRRSGVWWTQYEGPEAVSVVEEIGYPVDVHDQMLAWLGKPRAVLVVAWAIAVDTGGPRVWGPS